MTNRVIHELPALDWEGLPSVPCSVVDTSWSHRLASREYYGTDGEAHDDGGRKSLTVTVVLHFHNTYDPKLYPTHWTKWRKALLTGKIGKLRHPDIGQFMARVADGSFRISASEQAGITVHVTFVESLKAADQPTKFSQSTGAAGAAARKCDTYMASLNLDYPDGFPDPSLEEALAGFTGQFAVAALEFSGKVTALVGTVDRIKENLRMQCEMVRNADAAVKEAVAGSVERILLELQLDTLRMILTEAAKTAAQAARPVKAHTTIGDITFPSLSLDIGADLVSLLDLNPSLIGLPFIPKGTTVKFFGLS